MMSWDDANSKARELANATQDEREAYIVDELVSIARELRTDMGLSYEVFLHGWMRFAPTKNPEALKRIERQVRRRLGLGGPA